MEIISGKKLTREVMLDLIAFSLFCGQSEDPEIHTLSKIVSMASAWEKWKIAMSIFNHYQPCAGAGGGCHRCLHDQYFRTASDILNVHKYTEF